MMTLSDQIEHHLAEHLDQIAATGALCCLNVDGIIKTYSAGNISEEEHSSHFYIYSISKSITAAAILLLAEQGLLDLDENLSEWKSDYKIPMSVTIRHLLNHTGGLSDYFSSETYQQAVHAEPESPWPYAKLMEVGLSQTPLFAPEKEWHYSNPGYAILKELIEERSGQNYYKFVQANILTPLDLAETKPFDRLDHGVDLLPGYDPLMQKDFRKAYHPGWISTGCFISTVSDVSMFYQGLFSGRLLSPESLKEMTTTVAVPFPGQEPPEPRYGLGLMSFHNDPHGENYGHGGGWPRLFDFCKAPPSLQ